MKKTFLFLIMAAGLLSCAKEMTPAPEQAPAGVPMSFNITVTGTKAAKTEWANGDVVYVFFKGLKEKYLSLSYDGSKWTTASGGGTLTDTDFNGLTTKTLTAVHLPVAVDVAFADGAFTLTQDGKPVYNYYLWQKGAYEVDGTTVTATLEMRKPEGFAQFHVLGIPDGAEDYTLSCSEVQPIACFGVSTDGSFLTKSLEPGDPMRGVDDADGLVFGGRLQEPGVIKDYKFILTGLGKIYKLEREKALTSEVRYNFPAPADWTVVTNFPGYDFMHLLFYTFNVEKEITDFIQKRTLEENDGTIEWWAGVNPSYYIDPDLYTDPDDRVSNRYALADYDVAYFPLAELAFAVVDGDDNILTDAQMEAAGLTVKFTYADPDLGSQSLPKESILSPYSSYDDLWVDNTVFYYRTNEKKFIPVVGKLFLTVDGEEYELPTRFSRPKNSVKYPEVELDYSHFALVRWTPFEKPSADGITIKLDEHTFYRKPLFKGLNLKDNRPNALSFSVIENGNWVMGDAATNATASSGSNGYVSGISSQDAYQLTLSYEVGIPDNLKRLLTVEYSADGVNFENAQNEAGTLTPYIVYDYTSEVQFNGTISIPVTVSLSSPWQETMTVEYTVTVKGYDS